MKMNLGYEELIANAATNIDSLGGDVKTDFAVVLMQRATTWALIAIAQELHKVNERAEIEIERQEMIQERKERTKEIW